MPISLLDEESLRPIFEEPIEWEGDLEDDCSARWRGMLAHVECLGCHCECPHNEDLHGDLVYEGNSELEELGTETWYWSVFRPDPECQGHGRGGKCSCGQLWHTAENSGYTTTGEGARRFAELLMRLSELERLFGFKLETRRVW